MAGIQFIKIVVTVGVGHRRRQRHAYARRLRSGVQFYRHVGYAHVAHIVRAVLVVVHEDIVTNGYFLRTEGEVHRAVHVVVIQVARVVRLGLARRLRVRRQRHFVGHDTAVHRSVLPVVVVVHRVARIGARVRFLVFQGLPRTEVACRDVHYVCPRLQVVKVVVAIRIRARHRQRGGYAVVRTRCIQPYVNTGQRHVAAVKCAVVVVVHEH